MGKPKEYGDVQSLYPAQHMRNYFLGCKLVGKMMWLPHLVDVDPKKSKGKKRRLSTSPSPSHGSKADWDVYIFLVPKPYHDSRGKRWYGAVYPDGACQLWSREWGRHDSISRDITDADRARCKAQLVSFCKRSEEKEKARRLAFPSADSHTMGKRARVRLKKKTQPRTRLKVRITRGAK